MWLIAVPPPHPSSWRSSAPAPGPTSRVAHETSWVLSDFFSSGTYQSARQLSLSASEANFLIGLSFWSLAFFALLFGVANGVCIALYPAVAAGWYGTTHAGAILGVLYIPIGVVAVAGGSLGEFLFDLSHSCSASIVFNSFCALLSVLCIVMASRAVNKDTGISAID